MGSSLEIEDVRKDQQEIDSYHAMASHFVACLQLDYFRTYVLSLVFEQIALL